MARILILSLLINAVWALGPGQNAHAADAGLKEVIATVEQGYSSLTDLQADFTQRTMMATIKREQKGSGSLAIRKNRGGSAMFRFDYVKPRQLIVSDGIHVWYYLPENAQVIETSVKELFEGDNGIALNYLTGMGNISGDFKARLVNNGADAKGNYLLELVPKNPGRNLEKLQLSISGQAVERYRAGGKLNEFPILSSVTFDTIGTRSAIEFSNVRINRGLGKGPFVFRAPKGTEVIRRQPGKQ